MKEKHIVYGQSKIFYQTTGNGKPVLLLHGFGEDGNVWQLQAEKLHQHCTLIIPHLPGSGESELISDMSIEGMAECIKAIANEEGIKECSIIGHSMGGYITLALAEKHPSFVSSFGLVHSTAFADSNEKKQARRKSIEFIKENGAYAFLKTTITNLFFDENRNTAPVNQLMEGLIEKGNQFSPEALIHYYEAMINRPERTHVLKTFSKPVLFIAGVHDKAVPFEQTLKECHIPVQSHLHILRHSAHMGVYEETEKMNKALLEFLFLQSEKG